MDSLPDFRTTSPRVVNELPRTLGGLDGEGPNPGSRIVVWVNPEWELRFPWVVQGATGRAAYGDPGDFALISDPPREANEGLWMALAQGLGFPQVVCSPQVHGKGLHLHGQAGEGLDRSPPGDGHLSAKEGILMGVTVADCVPLFLVDPRTRSVAVLHAGWRGTAEGILPRAVHRMEEAFGVRGQDLFLHLGPAICGECYEVGPEVHEALGLSIPQAPRPVDLRAVQAGQALEAGLSGEKVTRSGFCTLCGASPFYSHRAGHPERQVGFLGIRPGPNPGANAPGSS